MPQKKPHTRPSSSTAMNLLKRLLVLTRSPNRNASEKLKRENEQKPAPALEGRVYHANCDHRSGYCEYVPLNAPSYKPKIVVDENVGKHEMWGFR